MTSKLQTRFWGFRKMINEVYQLIAPKLIDTAYKEINLTDDAVILRPVNLSICKADQRYYQGLRLREVLMKKLPMALIHECVAQVIYDPRGEFEVGELVVPIPNMPTQTDPVIAENYLRSSHFCSSGYDGFLRDYIQMPHDRLVRVPKGFDLRVASFSELVSVSVHAISRFEKFSNPNRSRIGVWGDGNVGFITALMLHYLYPQSELYIFGTVEDKLNFFSFAKETFHVDSVPQDIVVDHAFECVGGPGCRPAINQMIDVIAPEGSISLMGVSENFVDINTRMVLEKGLNLFGSSRSGRKDFCRTMEIFAEHPEVGHYLENLIGDVVSVRSIPDIHNAFRLDYTRNFGKTVIQWDK